MKKNFYQTFLLFFLLTAFLNTSSAQTKIDRVLQRWNKKTVPYIYVENVPTKNAIVYLDTRKKEEFNVSHIKNAIWVGYSAFDLENLKKRVPNLSQPIIVYCSIGVRSEDIGEQLIAEGYTKVLNLYGGIFEWKNKGNDVYHHNIKTDSIHAYNKHWGKLMHKGIKVF